MEKTGHLHIRLGELLEENGLSKNKFSQRAEMQRTQLNKYINDEVALLSVDVLERICSVLDCQISDLLEFKKENKN
ncbi:helix-turn-helix domain-containing protein [Clostridium fessum]|jgi:putative transcriptional regulator|uniref:helix-turn-helix domain-containing protein n=1 Tax=Clostridium fessum TaxID=2126740 RepID=UPI0022E1164A|nr:helix-turn-helix transcriptional regulator [Clostridium fessum]